MQRKKSKKTRLANADEKRFMSWVKDQCCIQCGASGVVSRSYVWFNIPS